MPNNTNIYIVPDQKIQAYAFGWRSIGVTEGALNLDTRTLEALIAHEYGHIVNGDSVLKALRKNFCKFKNCDKNVML